MRSGKPGKKRKNSKYSLVFGEIEIDAVPIPEVRTTEEAMSNSTHSSPCLRLRRIENISPEAFLTPPIRCDPLSRNAHTPDGVPWFVYTH